MPQILIPKFFLDRDDEYRRSELRKTCKKNCPLPEALNTKLLFSQKHGISLLFVML